MKVAARLVAVFVVVALIGGVLVGGWWLAAWLWAGLAGPERVAVLVAGMATGGVWLTGRVVGGAVRRAKWEDVVRARRERAGEVYARLVAMWAARLGEECPADNGARPAADRAAAERELILWGSGPVVAAYAAAFGQAGDQDTSEPSRLVPVLLAMRRDLGNRDAGLAAESLRALFTATAGRSPQAAAAPLGIGAAPAASGH